MLANIDVLIGLVVILLGVSLVITVINQALSSMLSTRAWNLRWGLSMLIQELHADKFPMQEKAFPLFGRELDGSVTKAVERLLSHRLVSDSKVPLGRSWNLASTIRFDEFIKVIHLMGARPNEPVLQWLRENNRITEPWFNSVMDRVSQRFAMHMRIYTIAVSLVVVSVIGMDTLLIIGKLRNDAALRGGLAAVGTSLSQADKLDAEAQKALSTVTKTAANTLVADQGVETLFLPFSWKFENLSGMVLSVLLLSLGAPFWFAVLKNLVALRSVVAKKEEKEQQVMAGVPDVGDAIRVRSF